MRPSSRIAGVLAVVLLSTAVHAGPAAAAPPAPVPSTAPAAQAITLITGDVVRLAPAGAGRYAATVTPGPGRDAVTFTTSESDGGLRVLPSDAIPMLAAGRLDAGLFDVQRLIADGYGDATSKTLPLIVRSSRPAGLRALDAAERPLASIGAVAVRPGKTDLAGFWRDQTGPRALTGGVQHIWLDGKVKTDLDRSTAQIGAPAAWAAGYDGTGVRVAVLDTGVDATHPDLAGRIAEARNFSESADTVDRHGHGTHVASIVAGSGAASAGTRKGVAPGARLLIGKVMDDNGCGYDSSIIAGMQWAVDEGAKGFSSSSRS